MGSKSAVMLNYMPMMQIHPFSSEGGSKIFLEMSPVYKQFQQGFPQ
jgi:hypothetical protein